MKEGIMGRSRGKGLYALRRVVWIIGLIAFGNGLVFGQGSTAAISGFVRDATGGVVPGVDVTVRNTESGFTRTVQSTENGGNNMRAVPVGPYRVTAEKAGFKQQGRGGPHLPGGRGRSE